MKKVPPFYDPCQNLKPNNISKKTRIQKSQLLEEKKERSIQDNTKPRKM